MKQSHRVQSTIYTLRIELQGIEPLIWRRLQVRSDTPLAHLHRVFQVLMGWTNSHLHNFHIGENDYGIPDREFPELRFVSERGRTLEALLGDRIREFGYDYDFGDGWEHRVVVESIGEGKPQWPYPLCLAGERACPPEDIGGTGGYKNFLEAIADAKHEEHESSLLWAGGAFDPEGFDINSVNRELRRLRL